MKFKGMMMTEVKQNSQSAQEALLGPHKEKWQEAMNNEMETLGRKVGTSCWIDL